VSGWKVSAAEKWIRGVSAAVAIKEIETRLVVVSDGAAFHRAGERAGAHLVGSYASLKGAIQSRLSQLIPSRSAGDLICDMCRNVERERSWQEALRTLIPAYIGMQAFFGINCPEGYGENVNAFLLPAEADWDFYAAIFDRLCDEQDPTWRLEASGEPRWSSEDESQAYRVRPLLELIDEVFPEGSAHASNKKAKGLLRNEDVLTLCALLANTTDYKGRYKSKRDALLGGLGFVRPEHSKFPSADDRPGEQYAHLVQQLRLWSQSRARAEAVVRTMESLLQLGPALGRDSP
jgi:hypothetical protein